MRGLAETLYNPVKAQCGSTPAARAPLPRPASQTRGDEAVAALTAHQLRLLNGCHRRSRPVGNDGVVGKRRARAGQAETERPCDHDRHFRPVDRGMRSERAVGVAAGNARCDREAQFTFCPVGDGIPVCECERGTVAAQPERPHEHECELKARDRCIRLERAVGEAIDEAGGRCGSDVGFSPVAAVSEKPIPGGRGLPPPGPGDRRACPRRSVPATPRHAQDCQPPRGDENAAESVRAGGSWIVRVMVIGPDDTHDHKRVIAEHGRHRRRQRQVPAVGAKLDRDGRHGTDGDDVQAVVLVSADIDGAASDPGLMVKVSREGTAQMVVVAGVDGRRTVLQAEVAVDGRRPVMMTVSTNCGLTSRFRPRSRP